MGFFDRPLFDFNGDGKVDGLEMAGIDIDELAIWMKMNAEKLWKMQGWIRMILMMNSRETLINSCIS